MRLYIDPGTGSMLFSLAVGLLSILWFGARKLFMKAKYHISGGTVDTKKKDIVIYGEDKRYWTTFKGILDEFEKRKVKVTYLAGSEDDPLLKEDYQYVETEVIGLGNKAYAKLNFLNARVVLATTPGLDVYQWKRSKDVDWYVHLTHTLGAGTGYRMFGTQFYDAVLLSSEKLIDSLRKIERLRESEPKDIVAVGSTYMDYMAQRRLSCQSVKNAQISILLAPSWGPSSILNRYGERFINALISTGYDITLRPHPQSYISEREMIRQLESLFPENEHFHWNRDADNFDILSKADILISDYSGILWDFSFVFEKPVIYSAAQWDLSTTDHAWLNEPLWIFDALPRIGVELKEDNIDRVKDIIDELAGSDDYHTSIVSARDDYWQNRGRAAESIVDYLIQKNNELIDNIAKTE